MPFFARLFYAWVVSFRVVFDGAFASRVKAAAAPPQALPPSETPAMPLPASAPSVAPKAPAPAESKQPPAEESALLLLAALQQEGRLLDFLTQNVDALADADVGAAARVIHAGCMKALRSHISLAPVRSEEEGATLEVAGEALRDVKVTGGTAAGGPPTSTGGNRRETVRGTLIHKGWRVTSATFPVAAPGHDARVLQQAEIEV